ncbi:MAG: transporter substrate-binding domain-containing protein [Actinomycetota bacterium]
MTQSKWFRLLALLFATAMFAAACGASETDEEGAEDDTDSTEETAEDSSDDDDAADGDDDEDTTVELTQGGSILATVQDRGTLNCGVSGAAVAFSFTQADGSVTGIDADYCRAVAAAVLGDSEAVEFVPLTAAERFTAVSTGDVDLLMRNSTWTQSRDTVVGMDFGPTTYYDGQQLMARAISC